MDDKFTTLEEKMDAMYKVFGGARYKKEEVDDLIDRGFIKPDEIPDTYGMIEMKFECEWWDRIPRPSAFIED